METETFPANRQILFWRLRWNSIFGERHFFVGVHAIAPESTSVVANMGCKTPKPCEVKRKWQKPA
jgi:hypothetical protein